MPWAEPRQVEQDLIISRAIVALFTDPFLARELRFRGGTALNKLHFPEPLRYSEDIDLVRSTRGPIGPVLDHARSALQPWLGQAAFEQSPMAPKLIFRVPAEDNAVARVVRCLIFHLERSGLRITRAEAERRMFAKLRKPGLMQDVRALLPARQAARLTATAARAAFTSVFSRLIAQLPGAPWNRTPEMAERFGIEVHAD